MQALTNHEIQDTSNSIIRLFRIISIPSKFCYSRSPDHVISMELLALNFRCQYTQQKLQLICAVLTFDPQLKKILTFSVKDRYQLNYFICIKDFNAETNTSLKLNVFFLYLWLSASSKENGLPLCIYFWYQIDSGVPNTSIYSAVSLASPYSITYNLPHLQLWYADVVTVIA
jgi:hypothetical protein